jgi:hemolysin activation/secretion protein
MVAIGGLAGLRGYRPWQFTGTGSALLNIEYRISPGVEFLYFRPAFALFHDAGTTWHEHQSPWARSWHRSAGAGLRIANRRFLGSTVIRFDAAHNFSTRQMSFILSADLVFRALGGVDTDLPTMIE